MLTEILMESLLSMDEDALDYVLESCTDDEIEIISDAMEAQIADRNNPHVQAYRSAMKQLRRPGAKTGTTVYDDGDSRIRYNGANGSISSTAFGTTKYKKYDDANKEFVNKMKKTVRRNTAIDNATNFVSNDARRTAKDVRDAGKFIANDAKQTVSDVQNSAIGKIIGAAAKRGVADARIAKKNIKTSAVNSLRKLADKIDN